MESHCQPLDHQGLLVCLSVDTTITALAFRTEIENAAMLSSAATLDHRHQGQSTQQDTKYSIA